MKLKRRILETLAQAFYSRAGHEIPAFRPFLANDPPVEDYASFRAVQEKLSRPWEAWPQRIRDGVLLEEDYCAEDQGLPYLRPVGGRSSDEGDPTTLA